MSVRLRAVRSALSRPAVAAIAVTAAVAVAACSGGSSSPDAAGSGSTASDERPKVTVTGDSISVGLGASLREALGDSHDVKVIGEVGSGLARPDNFDWPRRLRQLAEEFPPEVLVLSLGSNDATDLTDADGTTVVHLSDDDAWDEEYSKRLAEAFDAFEGTDTTVVWVGHVRTEEDRVGLQNRHIHELATELAATRDWVVVEDLGELLGSGDTEATRCLTDDGLHLTVACLDEAAAGLAERRPISS